MTKKCGTTAGHTAHRKNKQLPCNLCKQAYNSTMRQWKLKNKSKVLESKKSYREANSDKIRRYRQVYRVTNGHKLLENNRTWRRNNPDKYREQNNANGRRRRARKLNNGYASYTLTQVLEEYGSICYLCEKPIDLVASRRAGIGNWEMGLHLDHAIPLSKGGMDCIENVAPTHAICNLNKGPNHF